MRKRAVRALPLDPPQLIEIGVATPHREMLSPAAARFYEMAGAFFDLSGHARG